MFMAAEIRAHTALAACDAERHADTHEDDDDGFLEDPAVRAEEERRFALIGELFC